VGDKEVENGTIAVRSRKKGNEGEIRVEDFIHNIDAEIREKR
jgi:threonyl-tRNA synthetase